MKRETTETENSGYLRLLMQFGEAWDAGDVAKLVSMMTDDCVYCASVGPEPGTTYVGKEAVREGFVAMLAFDSGGVSRAGRVFIAGSVGVSEWSYQFRLDPTPILRFAGATSLNSAAVGFPVETRSGNHFPQPRRTSVS